MSEEDEVPVALNSIEVGFILATIEEHQKQHPLLSEHLEPMREKMIIAVSELLKGKGLGVKR